MKKLKIVFTLVCIWFSTEMVHAQVGIGTLVPEGALDITSNDDGLLIPRVALVNTTTVTVLTGTASELVYNTATSGDVTPGFYYLSSATGPWIRIATGASGWLTTGNTDIVDGTNFLGTAAATNVDVAFRRNNLPAGKIGLTSASFGVGALNVGAATNSAAFGNNALLLNTGNDNVAIGNSVLSSNTTGIQNTGVGNSALLSNTGSANSAFGFEALRTNSTGSNNTSFGSEAMRANTTASNNTGIGFQALRNNLVGTNNSALGFQALNNNRASFNTAVGTQASFALTTGTSNTSMGYQAHQDATTGSQNVAVGERSLGRNNGSANTIIGWEAMFGSTSSASNNSAIGWHALFNNSGANNTAIGYNASQGNTSATENTAVGAGSLNDNSTGSRNTAIGRNAGFAATSSDGTFVGYNAGAYSTGTQNAALGANALDGSGASARNVAVGYNALTNTSTASNNTALGHSALSNLVTGSGNVAIGYQAGLSETTSNKLYITNSNTTPVTSLIYGEFAPTRILRTNSTFQIGDPTTTGYVFPVARGTVNQYLASDASGVLNWVSPSGTNLLSAVRTNLNANQALTTAGWQLITYNTTVIDTNGEFAANRFTATRAGIYEINAGYHTDNQSNIQFYSIGVYVNGSLYQQTSGNHSNLGPVSRTINCIVNLPVGGYVEIFAENYQAGVQIDSFAGKSYFEVKQLR
jgi:trimeric autotransporter adhesin